jgi:hypothetical protein
VFRANTQIDFGVRNSKSVKDFLMTFELQNFVEGSAEDKAKRQRERMMNAKFFFSCMTGVGMESLSNANKE